MTYEGLIEGKEQIETEDEDKKAINTALYYLTGMNFLEIYYDIKSIKSELNKI
jgi:hypothetical protein